MLKRFFSLKNKISFFFFRYHYFQVIWNVLLMTHWLKVTGFFKISVESLGTWNKYITTFHFKRILCFFRPCRGALLGSWRFTSESHFNILKRDLSIFSKWRNPPCLSPGNHTKVCLLVFNIFFTTVYLRQNFQTSPILGFYLQQRMVMFY